MFIDLATPHHRSPVSHVVGDNVGRPEAWEALEVNMVTIFLEPTEAINEHAMNQLVKRGTRKTKQEVLEGGFTPNEVGNPRA